MWDRRRSVGLAARVAALEALRANVMVADAELNITYCNPSVVALLREAEADLKRELPRFDVATLIGSNIDVFHKDPSHQRGMLAKLTTQHNATIRVGKRQFDLLVTPLQDGPKRIGFVVEWADAKERLLNLDYAAQIAAIGRSQAVIEFNTDGTIIDANANFLRAMGYSIEEVRGKHHSMFVDVATRASADYAAFWDRLKKGEYQASQFKRLSRSGEEVWIEGSYNPILDTNGKVAKVVKFASDVTAQQKLLSNLKTLIDKNFAEIGTAMSLSTAAAESATGAAGETSANVQTVAASAEQLAASIDEIASSMATSRGATERAYDQAVALGRSTETLANAAQAMNGIVALIRDVASQINLLALNATIEAARAGEAGKGFAVVASEVKNLAIQAAKATERISTEIDGIQTTSTEVAGALGTIRDAVTTVRESVTLTASAVEEQSAVTRGMSSSMRNASLSVSTVGENIGQISAAVQETAAALTRTREAAEVLVK